MSRNIGVQESSRCIAQHNGRSIYTNVWGRQSQAWQNKYKRGGKAFIVQFLVHVPGGHNQLQSHHKRLNKSEKFQFQSSPVQYSNTSLPALNCSASVLSRLISFQIWICLLPEKQDASLVMCLPSLVPDVVSPNFTKRYYVNPWGRRFGVRSSLMMRIFHFLPRKFEKYIKHEALARD